MTTETPTPAKKRAPKKAAAPSKVAATNGHPDDDDDAIDDTEIDESVVEHNDDESDELEQPEGGFVEDQARRVAQKTTEKREQTEEERQEDIEEAAAELRKLEPIDEPISWTIGQPLEMDGNKDTYSIYLQDKLNWMPRQKFFALVTKTMSNAIKEAGSDASQMAEVFGGEGSIIERGRRLSQRDFTDAASFFTLAMELVSYSPQFLVDCYVIWLEVPRDERRWARDRFSEPWNPAKGQWGLKDEDHEKLIATFIDQNYEDIRRFFVVTLPGIARRVSLHEKSKDRKSKSDRSK